MLEGWRTMCQFGGRFILTLLTFIIQITFTFSDVITCHHDYYKWPACIDYPDGYGCGCGPAFFWNTQMCVASGLDSRLEFSSQRPVRYTLLMNKPFPTLESFTIALWLNIPKPRHPGTVISYSAGDQYNIFRITTGPTLEMKIHNEVLRTSFNFNASQWIHFAWTWTSKDGTWRAYINGGNVVLKGTASRADKPIPSGGELVIGQSARTPATKNLYNTDLAFLGQMSYVNIWHHVMRRSEIREVFRDCKLMRCGDAVEWADFRSGTRGEMRMRWPSNIFGITMNSECFTDMEAGISCDKYCSHVIGAQCNEQILENIHWKRTPADMNATVPCPGLEPEEGSNMTALVEDTIIQSKASAYRHCAKTEDNETEWGEPLLNDCISEKELRVKLEIVKFKEETKDMFNQTNILRLARRLQNQTTGESYQNPIDIAAVIDCLQILVTAQREALNSILVRRGAEAFGLSRVHDKNIYPKFQDTTKFTQAIVKVMDALLYDRNDIGWLTMQPQGSEGNHLFAVIDEFVDLSAESLQFHIGRGDVEHDRAKISALYGRAAFHIQSYKMEEDTFKTIIYPPDPLDLLDYKGSITLFKEALLDLNVTTLPEYITISMGYFHVPKILPNHNVRPPKGRDMDNNVNSAVYALNIHMDDERLDNLSMPITVKLPYLDNFNISNTECVNLGLANDSSGNRAWLDEKCELTTHHIRYAICECRKPGMFAVITDMYDVNWDKGEKPIILMEIPSYIGCSLSALLCLTTCILLVYFKTSSKTASIHKNFAMANVGGQVVFMFGIDRMEYETLCKACAIALHYFFLAAFLWLMNEAFNLYIVITYAAHSHGEHTESGSQWRYYILGWMLPVVLVGALVGAHHDYYATEMCWIAWQYLWLFLGPAIGIISVTVLVLIFIAKEHNESSYSKNEKTNKTIVIYSKALWTQVILITLQWSFAILSIKMRGIIVKCLFALFNGLQGAFFFVFYFLLHDEIRTLFQSKAKKKTLEKQGYEYSPTSSMDDIASMHEMIEREPEPEIPETSSSVRSRKVNGDEGGARKRARANIEASTSEESDSDCEVMITTV